MLKIMRGRFGYTGYLSYIYKVIMRQILLAVGKVWIKADKPIHLFFIIKVMKEFKDTKVAKILKARWAGEDMESYFIEKSKKFIVKLKEEVKK